jgi:hypothetical protein
LPYCISCDQGCQLKSLYYRVPFDDFHHYFPCRLLVVRITSSKTRIVELNSHHQQCPMRVEGIHTNNWVLSGAPRGSFATLLSPCQCHAAFGTMPHTLASVDHSPVLRHRTLSPSATRTPRFGFWRENRIRNVKFCRYHTQIKLSWIVIEKYFLVVYSTTLFQLLGLYSIE